MMTEAERKQVRIILQKALGIPKSGVGCILIIVEERPDGDSRQHLISMGLSDEGIHTSVAMALNTVEKTSPATYELSPIPDPT